MAEMIHRVLGRLGLALGLVLIIGRAASAQIEPPPIEPTRIDGSPLGPVHYYAPPKGRKIDGLVVMISDRPGWDAAAAALSDHLSANGQVVVGLDLPVYAAALRKDSNDCVLVTRDIEVLARDVEKDLPFAEFRPPVIVGLGAGSGLAYAAIGQVLPNTFAGGVGIGFDPVIDVGHKLCLPLAPTEPGAPLRYGPVTDHETPFLFTPSPEFAGAGLKDFLAAMPQAHLLTGHPDEQSALDDAIQQIPRVGRAESSVDGLPIVELPPSQAAGGQHALVIFYSGDGGWRDIDKKIGGYLADRGFFVVGVDALRYFWRKKDPLTMASDLDRLIRHYADRAKPNGVALVGYSFGADVLPFMYNRMALDAKERVKFISLIGIAEHASFEIRLQGILGATNTDGPPTLPELIKLTSVPVQCFFGFDEHDTVCAAKELDGIVDRVELGGGHHFNGDYNHIADLLVAAADKAVTDQAATENTTTEKAPTDKQEP